MKIALLVAGYGLCAGSGAIIMDQPLLGIPLLISGLAHVVAGSIINAESAH